MLIFYLLESIISSEDAELLLTCADISVCSYCFHCRKCCFIQDHLTQYEYTVQLFHNLL
jgi:hypothetical protein